MTCLSGYFFYAANNKSRIWRRFIKLSRCGMIILSICSSDVEGGIIQRVLQHTLWFQEWCEPL